MAQSAMNGMRQTFTYHRSINWFPGHMAKGLRQIRDRLRRDVDLVVEFERLPKKQRLIVYNKADLADPRAEEPIQAAFRKHADQSVVFTDANGNRNIRQILEHAADVARNSKQRLPHLSVLVVGMPNVGKSSLINALRRAGLGRGKAAATGAQPGVTRQVVGTIKVFSSPDIYLIDSPGVMVPHIEDPVTSLKVAVTGGIRDHLADEEIMADFLLYSMNQQGVTRYVDDLKLAAPSDDIQQVLLHTAARIGSLRRGGEPDIAASALYFIRRYREGRFGAMTLDDYSEASLARTFATRKR